MLVVGAELLLVVALVALNLYLWLRPGRDATSETAVAGATATSVASTAAGADASTPAGGSVPTDTTTTATTAATTDSTGTTTSPATGASSGTTAAAPSTAAPATTAASGPAGAAAALTAAGRLVLVVDTSDGMADELPAVKDGLRDLLRQAPDGVTVGLLTYAADGAHVAAAPATLDAGRRDDLLRLVDGLSTSTPDRPLFDTLVLGYQYALAGQPGAEPAPILLVVTNGGSTKGADLQTFELFARSEAAKRARAATPRFVAISPGADVPLLTRAATDLGGTVVPAQGPDRIRGAITDLPTPAPSRPSGSPSS